MRLRNVRGSREVIAVNEYVVRDEQTMKGRWHELFGNDNPIHIEVGMGKGRFIMDMARLNPDINYVGIEKFSSVLIRAIEKQEIEKLPNLYFIRMEAEYLENVFDKGEVSYIYLNFSDPWPKDRHAKRRLTSVQFLERYKNILSNGGGVTFKTDNRPLFDFTIEQADAAGWRKESVTYDLHNSPYAEGNVMTEYEERFSSMGNPICRIVYYPE
ncbi:MAG: tRNA (guanosine(46)-N7)-methyltransferase TrmB [Lachnospiraceae bacterium]|nr:tRNA (guanosine(46)-N7)-methyltransferase TrmB [Lachnospiraceae bacterium]